MTTAAVTATVVKPGLRAGTRMSLDEFLALGETDERLELIDGALYLMPTPTKDHQFLMGELYLYLALYLNGFALPPAEVYQDITTILSTSLQTAVEPDLVVILSGRSDIGGRIHVEGVPDIVVEILSSDRSHDLVRKRQIYAEAGVREYWILDPRHDTVALLELRGGVYVARATLAAGDTLTTPLLPGLAVPLADIFQHPRRPARAE